jgi:hypothetical protein
MAGFSRLFLDLRALFYRAGHADSSRALVRNVTAICLHCRLSAARYPQRMDAIGISASGLHAANMRLTASASNVANVASEGYAPVRAVQGDLKGGGVAARIEISGAPSVSLTDEMVGMLTAKIAFQANAKMLESIHNLESGLVAKLA